MEVASENNPVHGRRMDLLKMRRGSTQWAWRGWWVDMLWPSLTHGSNFLSDQEKNNSSFRQICFPRENTFFGYQFVWHSIQLPKTDLIRTQNFQKVCIKDPGPSISTHLASMLRVIHRFFSPGNIFMNRSIKFPQNVVWDTKKSRAEDTKLKFFVNL